MLGNFKMGQGIKRKLEDLEFDKCPNSERQLILDISLSKLNFKSTKRVEPPLHRSVLILNTLKLIEYQLIEEGMQSTTNTSAFSIPEVDPNSTAIDFLPEYNEGSKITDMFEQTGPLPSFDTFVGSRTSIPDQQHENSSNDNKYRISHLTETPQSLYHSPLQLDEIFNELDLALSDQDMFSAVTDGAKLTPLSAEVLHSFPSTSAAFTCDTYTTLSNAGLLPFCKSDTVVDDLDNIMQILVGS